ncbi:hypothetical protein DI243_11980 [Paenibacillus polymyxa]|nr:hypothetical protein DI243_11980 [Paenibacillus polymyxa]
MFINPRSPYIDQNNRYMGLANKLYSLSGKELMETPMMRNMEDLDPLGMEDLSSSFILFS